MLKVRLAKKLRKSIKQGHPWLYKSAIEEVKSKQVEICKVVDQKNDFLAWGYFDPLSDIAVRILSLQKTPPNNQYFNSLINSRFKERQQYFKESETNCFRLLNGEGDGCLLYTSPSPRDRQKSRMPSSA